MSDSLVQPYPQREPAGDARVPEVDVVLRDGRTVHLRSICASDEAEVVQAFERLSPEARYMRFMRVVKEPNMERLRKTLATFPQGGDVVIATVPAADGIDIVGSATYVILDNSTGCEFAISVAADYGGAGLGSTLMRAIIDAASRRGLKEMEGFVLAANQPMLRLASRMGFTIARDPEDASVRLCHLQLQNPAR
ncbi:MAG TPA: GNAT family N-acetyltransferase [Xanthomonadales bacterium]|nr:GNAT family N-acetyltransferase [Xanthomonadales bacterium]